MVASNSTSTKTLTTKEVVVLLSSVLIVGFCTIIYELLIGGVSSYFLGDSIRQFSLVIGLSMTAMGIGTLLSRLINKNLLYYFILLEIVLAFVGGLSVPILYYSYVIQDFYYVVMSVLILIIGILIGLEIPLLTRIMEKYYDLKNNISNVLSLDYLGSFVATLLFPFVLLPVLGVFNTSVFAGALNLIVATINFVWFKDKITIKKRAKLKFYTILITILLIFTALFSKELMRVWENTVYDDRVIFSAQTKYQKLILTKNKDDIRLFIDGNVQFSSIDEHRYHELLVHIPMNLAQHKEEVLLLGGGDGLAVRELLKYPEIKNITVVDLDKEMTDLAIKNSFFKELNQNSLLNKKVKIINDDAFKFIENSNKYYDVIIADLPDPNNSSLARLYSKEFYKLIKNKMSKQGIFVTQATSPFFSPEAYWCITETLKSVGYNNVKPYHGYVPSFGDWGFVMASNINYDINDINLDIKTKYLDNELAKKAFVIEKDIQKENIKPSKLDSPEILNYYLKGWKYWN